jgi:carnitine O-acetyltransferase
VSQAAYFILYGRTESTYEPAMTKAFYHGRTEAIRTVQPESVAFVKLFASDAPAREKVNALRKACQAHVELTRNCAAGLGQDRVLYAMYCLAQRADAEDSTDSDDSNTGSSLPAIFKDPGYATLNHSVLSTSSCGNPGKLSPVGWGWLPGVTDGPTFEALRAFGFGPTVPDGYGIGYIIKEDSLHFVASSKHLQTKRYLDTLRAYLLDAQRMLVQLHRQANERPSFTFVDHHKGEVDARTGRPIRFTASPPSGAAAGPDQGDTLEDVMGGYVCLPGSYPKCMELLNFRFFFMFFRVSSVCTFFALPIPVQ